MSKCTLLGIAHKQEGTKEISGADILCPFKAIGMSELKGAICGSFGVKSSRYLSGLLIEHEVVNRFEENRSTYEIIFDVPRDDNDIRLDQKEMLNSRMLNMLRIRKDAADYICDAWSELLPEYASAEERKFPRVPTQFPHLIPALRKHYLPKAELIIFPVKVGYENLAFGAYFGKECVSSIRITM